MEQPDIGEIFRKAHTVVLFEKSGQISVRQIQFF